MGLETAHTRGSADDDTGDPSPVAGGKVDEGQAAATDELAARAVAATR
jgi:hypothetical protein